MTSALGGSGQRDTCERKVQDVGDTRGTTRKNGESDETKRATWTGDLAERTKHVSANQKVGVDWRRWWSCVCGRRKERGPGAKHHTSTFVDEPHVMKTTVLMLSTVQCELEERPAVAHSKNIEIERRHRQHGNIPRCLPTGKAHLPLTKTNSMAHRVDGVVDRSHGMDTMCRWQVPANGEPSITGGATHPSGALSRSGSGSPGSVGAARSVRVTGGSRDLTGGVWLALMGLCGAPRNRQTCGVRRVASM